MDQNQLGLSRDLIIHPGETLFEVLEDRQMSQKELSVRTDVTEKHISSIVRGKSSISNAFARKLEYALNIPSSFWTNLQSNYDQELLAYEEANNISNDEIKILKPLEEIIKYFSDIKLMDLNDNEAGYVLSLRRILGVNNLTVIPNITYNAAYRAQTSVTIDTYVLFAWQVLCEKLTENIDVKSIFDKEKLIDLIPKIKRTMFRPVASLQKELSGIFSECGIAFAIVPNFKGAPVQGFIKQCESTKKMILCMTIRGSFADRFWFTLFHEIGHLINGDIKQKFIDFEKVSGVIEEKADKFAKETLINEKNYMDFVEKENYSYDSICEFAKQEEIPAYAVIGRLEKDQHIHYSKFAKLKTKYVWK